MLLDILLVFANDHQRLCSTRWPDTVLNLLLQGSNNTKYNSTVTQQKFCSVSILSEWSLLVCFLISVDLCALFFPLLHHLWHLTDHAFLHVFVSHYKFVNSCYFLPSPILSSPLFLTTTCCSKNKKTILNCTSQQTSLDVKTCVCLT